MGRLAVVAIALGACGRIGFDPGGAVRPDGPSTEDAAITEIGLIAHWKLDETSGTTAFDSSGNGHDGDLLGGPTWQPTSGHDRGALRCDWVFPHADGVLADHPLLHVTSSFSIAAWVRFDGLSGSSLDGVQNIAGVGTDSANFFTYRLTQNAHCGGEHFALRVAVDETTPVQGAERCSTTVVTTGSWFHVVGVYEATTPALDLFVDGAFATGAMCPAGTCGTTTIPTALADAASPFTIGGDRNLKNAPSGLIDDVRVYDRALTAADVTRLFATGTTAP